MPARPRRRAVGPAGAVVTAGRELLPPDSDQPADERAAEERDGGAAGRADDERLLADRPRTMTTASEPASEPAADPAAESSAAAAAAGRRTDRAALLGRYRTLVGDLLPVRAGEQRWVLRNDHCFGRVLLDAAVGRCWYEVLDRRRPAYAQLDDAQLTHAVELGERLLAEGDPLLRELDAQSLRWRGKPPKRG